MIVAAAAFHFLDREFLVAQEGFKQRLNFHGFYFYLRFAAVGRKRVCGSKMLIAGQNKKTNI